MPQEQLYKGKVIIAGAGPGDPDLITIKAMKYLAVADIILTDRLVSSELLDRYANPSAIIISVGKQCRHGHSTPQETINALLVEHASQGRLVVRLKGGDVSVFANVLDELSVLTAHCISFEIIPGITAATGAAAYAGIPLTARGYATAVRLLTYYKSDILSDAYWEELASTDDTLVFYMSAEMLQPLVHQLKRFGIDPSKQLAVIEQATTPCQHVQVSSLYDLQLHVLPEELISPTLIIVGKVVGLHHQFSQKNNNHTRLPYFKPVRNPVAKQQFNTLIVS
jgi:uroporphyrin-III C-methyltransferase/precorrin-2 dehydrogenase/sirohydrochlorin ferrochelatase/uroporphyrin-III C-methyltransferase